MDAGLDFTLHAGEPAVFLRLLIAALAGGAVGWNRFRAGKPAGVGTHALVALGSAIFVAVPLAMTKGTRVTYSGRWVRLNRLIGK